jgi:hypothetical protein
MPVKAGRENALATPNTICSGLDEVGSDEDRPPPQAIGEHAAQQDEDDHRHLAREEDDAELGYSTLFEDRECQRDGGHATAERRDGARAEKAREVAIAQYPGDFWSAHEARSLGWLGEDRGLT